MSFHLCKIPLWKGGRERVRRAEPPPLQDLWQAVPSQGTFIGSLSRVACGSGSFSAGYGCS